jgi:hypothetical protein
VRAALSVAWAWGNLAAAPEVDVLVDRVLAMVWRLTHGARPSS